MTGRNIDDYPTATLLDGILDDIRNVLQISVRSPGTIASDIGIIPKLELPSAFNPLIRL